MKTISVIPTKAQCERAKSILRLRPIHWDFVGGKTTSILFDRNHQSIFKRGRWKTVATSSHVVSVLSYLEHGLKLVVLHGICHLTGKPYKRRQLAPKGYSFSSDDFGFKVVETATGADYHPSSDELRGSVSDWVARLVSNREGAEKVKLEAARSNAEFLAIHGGASTRVTLEDSMRAGNCVEGTLRFCEAKLGIRRADIIAARHLVTVSADRLLGRANGDIQRVKRAIICAFERETAISI